MLYIFSLSKYYTSKYELGGGVETFKIPHIGAEMTYELDEKAPKFQKGGAVSDNRVFRYIDLEPTANGLKIVLNEEGREYLEEHKDEGEVMNFIELFEDVEANSEYLYHPDGGDAGFGLTLAPVISDGYYFDDNRKLTDKDNEETSEVFAFMDYQVVNPADKLLKDGEVVFERIGGENEKFKNGGKVNAADFNKDTDKWFDDVVKKSKKLKGNKEAEAALAICDKEATKDNLVKLKSQIKELPLSDSVKSHLEKNIDSIISGHYNEFRLSYGGKRGSGGKKSAASEFFSLFEQAITYDWKS